MSEPVDEPSLLTRLRALILLIAILVLAASLIWFVLLTIGSDRRGERNLLASDVSAPLNAPVLTDDLPRAVSIAISITAVDRLPLIANNSGVVTSATSDEPQLGKSLLHINDAPIIAYAAPAPIYQDVTEGSSLSERLRVREAAASMGFEADPEMVPFDELVMTMNLALFDRPSDVFEIADFVWVGSADSVNGGLTALVGSTIVAGDQIGDGQIVGTSASVQVTGRDGFSAPLPPDAELRGDFGGVEVVVSSDDLSVASQSLLELAQTGNLEVRITVRTENTTRVSMVPTSALIRNADRTCIMFTSDSDDNGVSDVRRVVVVGEEPGLYLLEPVDSDQSISLDPIVVQDQSIRDQC